MKINNDTVYCDVQMPGAQGIELLKLVTKLRLSGDHPNLDRVFQHMQTELEGSINCLVDAPSAKVGESS